jgi:hypothetical protein
MTVDLTRLTGEELLLVSVLYGPEIQPAVDRELDRRAVSPRAGTSRRRPAARAAATPWQRAQHAA